jgi:hypothetical protein
VTLTGAGGPSLNGAPGVINRPTDRRTEDLVHGLRYPSGLVVCQAIPDAQALTHATHFHELVRRPVFAAAKAYRGRVAAKARTAEARSP